MKKKETKTETVATEETLKTKRVARTRKKAEAKPAEESKEVTTAPVEAPAEKTEEKPAEKPAKKRTTRKKKTVEEPAETPASQEKPVAAEAPEKQDKQEAPEPKTEPKKDEPKPEPKAEPKPEPKAEPKKAEPKAEPKKAEPKPEPQKPAPKPEPKPEPQKPAPKPVTIPPMQNVQVHDFCDLASQTGKLPLLNDQQIQMLTWEEAQRRSEMLERILRTVLDYDVVLSDTNIWLELLVGHSSSHSDPRVNARLQFERQLESLSKMMKRIGGRFMVMSETYEEIDRFATAQEPVNYKDADWSDEALCRNVAARLAKRLMLAQQKENRLRIEGIGSESHHESFADPAIIRRTVEFFATGKKVLLLTNDTSVGIRSLGMCDDLQRVGNIDDQTWRTVYEPQRPMVLTMDDLKLLDNYMRQYYYLCTAAGRTWMQDAVRREAVVLEKPLELWLEGFRPGNRKERRGDRKEQERAEQERKEQERAEQQRREQERREQQRRADKERAEREREARRKAEQEAAEQNAAEQKAELKAEQKAEQEAAPEAAAPDAAEKPAPAEGGTQTAAPDEKKSRSRRGGRGRRGKKANAESA